MTKQETRSVIIERDLAHPPEKVWRALTESSLIADWLMNNDFQPVVGRKFNLRAQPQPGWSGVLDCEVLVVEPFTRLSYRWDSSLADGPNGVKTIVTWTLTPTSGGTHVRMEQAGFSAAAEAERYYQGATYGWQMFFGKLDGVVGGIS